jgi:hypothetical protein
LSFGHGLPFDHDLILSLEFESPITFKECIDRLLTIRSCFTFIAGRAQTVAEIQIAVQANESKTDKTRLWLDVDWSFRPEGEAPTRDTERLELAMPIQAVRDQDEFSGVVTNWIAKHVDWKQSRRRYIECIEKGRRYPADRLVAAANMFDLLPSSAVPSTTAVSADLKEAVAKTKMLFKNLDNTPERNSILGAIGRIGMASLPTKVFFRADIALRYLSPHLPHLKDVLRVAIQCRNYFVHGSEFNISVFDQYIIFMTKTLEFVFATSDLIDCGWHVPKWQSRPKIANHKFVMFLQEYRETIPSFMIATNAT